MTDEQTRHDAPSKVRFAIGSLELFIGLNGIWGGVMLMRDAWRMPDEWLRHTPFDDWFLPGLALLAFIGVGASLAGLLTLTNRCVARMVSTWLGAGLCAWIVVQLAWLRIVHPVMQPFVFMSGAAIVLLARRLPASPVSWTSWRHAPWARAV